MRKAAFLAVIWAVGSIGACAGEDPDLPAAWAAGDAPHSSADQPRHVYVRIPEGLGGADHLYEGAGLIESIPPAEMDGRHGWWLAFLDQHEVEMFERAGAEVRERGGLDPGVGPLELGNYAEQCISTPASNTFCSFDTTLSRCSRNISAELSSVPTDYPASAFGGVTYASVFTLQTTSGGRPIKAVRIGKHHVSGGSAIPQVMVYAGQHAREWVSVEIAMRLLRHLARSFRDNTNGVRTLLANTSVVIVPVANPDGYAYTHQSPANRNWRPSRSPCDNGHVGVDPNRNFWTTWGAPGASATCATNENSSYRGDDRGGEKETVALDILGIFGGGSGSYATRLGLNLHAYGNYLMFPEGISSDLGICTTNTNCTAPDLGAFYKLVHNGVNARIGDEESGVPYVTGSTMRTLYAVSGDSATRHNYTVPRFLTVGAEMTHTACGFRAELLASSQLATLETNWKNFATHLIGQTPSLYSGAFFDSYTLPHIHRRQLTGTAGELPTLRASFRKTLTSPGFYHSAGTSAPDEVQPGAAYSMARWRPNIPYVFPRHISMCGIGAACRYVDIAAPAGATDVNLCSSSRFTGSGFSWQPDLAGSPREECFWAFTRTGSAPYRLTSGVWQFPDNSRLIFSSRWRASGVSEAQVLVSSNGFVNCSTSTGTGCRIVRKFPHGTSNYELRSTYHMYRTEIVDVSDFDLTNAQIRFEVISSSPTPPAESFDVVDPVVVGWSHT
jgi:hypothetical protein